MSNFEITMPYRHTVRYQSKDNILEFEVELLTDSILFYNSNPKIIEGKKSDFTAETRAVEEWLRMKFSNVEIGTSSSK